MAAPIHLRSLAFLTLANSAKKSYVSKANLSRRLFQVQCALCSNNAPDITRSLQIAQKKSEKISQAMQLYIEKTQAYDDFMQKETDEFEIGKRHLANIMGLDPDDITQQEIDEAVSYLLPSGLFDKKARPLLKHPGNLFPKKKAVQFDQDGRPHHYLFYTGKPNFYDIMHKAAVKFEALEKLSDQMYARGIRSQQQVVLHGSDWIPRQQLEELVLERVSEQDHQRFTALLQRLAECPASGREQDFIMQFRQTFKDQSLIRDIPELTEDENGRKHAEAEGRRKTSWAWCRVTYPGTGNLVINGQHDVTYFWNIEQREQLLFPLSLSDMIGNVDIEVKTEGGGPSSQAGAIRLALSTALTSFVPPQVVERLRLAGLLTKDVRRRERKKPGQARARRKFTWKKR